MTFAPLRPKGRSRHVARCICALAAMFFGAAVLAQDYPNRPVKIIVPFAAGGPAFNWVPTSTGSFTIDFGSVPADDYATGPFTIGFPFKFYPEPCFFFIHIY